jgi:hypothetical protein
MQITTRSPLVRRVAAASALLGVLGATGTALVSPAAAAPAPTPKACKSVTRNISYLNIAATSAKHPKGAAGCQEANDVGNTWMLRFKAHMQVQRFKLNFIDYRCSAVPVIPRNQRCSGGGTIVRFAAPTGG